MFFMWSCVMPRIAYKILRKAKERKLPFSRSASVLIQQADAQAVLKWLPVSALMDATGMIPRLWEGCWTGSMEGKTMFQQRWNSLISNVPFYPFIFSQLSSYKQNLRVTSQGTAGLAFQFCASSLSATLAK